MNARPLRSLPWDHPVARSTPPPPRRTKRADELQPKPGRPGRSWMTVEEVAAELRVCRMTIYRLVDAGDLPGIRVGRSLRIDERDLDAYIAGQEQR